VADDYIAVDITADETVLADNAIQRLIDQWADWEPSEGDLEVVIVEALAQMAADAAQVAAIMPDAAFHTMLEQLFEVTIDEGQVATTTVTFTLLDANPHTIPLGTEIDIDGYAFTVDDDTPTSATTKANVPVTAAEPGADFNGLVGDQVVMLSALAFVVDVTLDLPPAGGTDPEEEAAFLSRGSQELELLAKTLVTVHDYELLAIQQPSVGRVAVSNNMTTRTITVTATTALGDPLPTPEKTALAALYDEYRQTTWVVTLADATKTTIGVTFQVRVYGGYDKPTAVAEATDLVRAFLDPSTWGVPGYRMGSESGIVTEIEPRVRKNKLIDLIGNAQGVDYVVSVTITGSAGSTDAPTGDWIMPGAVPLPVAGTVTGTAV
jgi:hypothetical protein